MARMLHIGLALARTWGPPPAPDQALALDCALAVRAEAAHLDFVFKPDSLYIDPKGAGPRIARAMLDPTLVLTAVAGATRRIGLVTTVSTSFNPPYVAARQLQTLNWLSNGRAGWNIVTALDGERNFGLAAMPSAAERYARAAEFTDVVRRLWDSHGAEGLAAIDHCGAFYQVEGPLNVPRHPARVALFQAGASAEGRGFAASVADAIFASVPDPAAGQELRSDLQRRARAAGRDDAPRLLPGFHAYLAPSRSEAQEMFREAQARRDPAALRAKLGALVGRDLGDWPEDRPLTPADLPAGDAALRSRTHSGLLQRLIRQESPPLRDLLLRPEVANSGHWTFVGTPAEALAEIAAWSDAGVMDGFIALPGGSGESLDLLLSDLIPALAEARRFRHAYAGETLAAHLGLASPASSG